MEKNKLSEMLLSFIIFLLGICLVVWADKVTSIVSILLGSLAILYGIVTFVKYYKNDSKVTGDRLHFIYAIIVMVIGFVLVFRVNFLKELISFIIGIYIVLSSVVKLQDALIKNKKVINGSNKSIILSIIGIVIGILCIVGKFLIPDIIIQFIGVMLILYGVVNIINIFVDKDYMEEK